MVMESSEKSNFKNIIVVVLYCIILLLFSRPEKVVEVNQFFKIMEQS